MEGLEAAHSIYGMETPAKSKKPLEKLVVVQVMTKMPGVVHGSCIVYGSGISFKCVKFFYIIIFHHRAYVQIYICTYRAI